MNVLELRPDSVSSAFKMLGPYRSAYDNDGTEPDGSAWLPKDEIPEELVQQVVEAHLGRIIEVRQWSDADVVAYLQTSQYIAGNHSFSTDSELLEMLSTEKVCAHYGTIGTASSLWLVSDAQPYPPQTPEEKLALFHLGMLFSTEEGQR